MNTHLTPAPPISGEPTWEIAHLFPSQGSWSEYEYLSLNGNRLVELSDGRLEVVRAPTELHQLIVLYLYEVVKQFVAPRNLGTVLVAPLRVKLWARTFREPDVIFMLAKNKHRRGDEFWKGADLVMEVVSKDAPNRDLEVKRGEYAKARIAEYWIVDPRDETITVLTLRKGKTTYSVAGKYCRGQQAQSVLLRGFLVDVEQVFLQE